MKIVSIAAGLILVPAVTAWAQTPITIFGNAVPQNPVIPDSAVTLGVKFYSTQAGTIAGIRFYRGQTDPSGYTVELFSSSGTLLGSANARDTCSVPCWEQINFASPISIAANTTYVAAYYASNGDYADDTGTSGGLTNGASNGPLIAPASSQVGGNGVYTYSRGFPNQTWQDSNYYVDVSFTASAPVTSPSITVNGASGGTTLSAGATMSVAVANGPGSPTDWIGVCNAGATPAPAQCDGAGYNWNYLNCTQTAPTAGVTSATCSLRAPSANGSYIAGFFTNNTYTEIASAPFTITSGSAGGGGGGTGGGGGGTGGLLASDRDASANWRMAGMLSVGGIPNRTTVCANLKPLGGGQDDTTNINNAINACPAGQVVQLATGTFTINEGSIIQLNKAVTLRGAGPTLTHLVRTNGAQLGSYFPGSKQSELIRISGNGASGNSVALTADVAQGVNSVQVASASGYSVGEIVLLDEASGASWQTDRSGQGAQIWAAPDYRVVWNIHNPAIGGDDGAPAIYSYFQVHSDHPTNEMHQISAISGNTIHFDSPVTISYRMSHGAQLTPMIAGPTNAGVEGLQLQGGDNGNIRFERAAYAWAKDIDSSLWLNEGFAIDSSFRVQLEGIYIHEAVWPVPGGGGYAISFAFGSSEALIENSISVLANKVMVARASGTGSVIAYNYIDDGFISGQDGWVEIGLNGSHLVGSHHILFEGNWGFNSDSDQTHGNAIYHSFFRNWLTGYRDTFTDYLNNTVVSDVAGCCSPLRAAGAHAYAYWFSFVGNVLGTSGRTSGWTYNCVSSHNNIPNRCIWDLGWLDISPQGYDPNTASTALQDGNFDYLTNSIQWAAGDTTHALPNSLYLSGTPTFFNAGSGYAWPWVDPINGTVYTLPAKARYDAGTPFTQP